MPLDDASRTIQHYLIHNLGYVIETTYDSEPLDQCKPEKKSRLPNNVGQKSITSSNKDVRYPSIRSTSNKDNDNGNSENPLPMPAKEESLLQTSRSRTPSLVKKLQSSAAWSKVVEELQTTQINTRPTNDHSLNQGTSRPNAVTDSKPSTFNNSSCRRLDDGDYNRDLLLTLP